MKKILYSTYKAGTGNDSYFERLYSIIPNSDIRLYPFKGTGLTIQTPKGYDTEGYDIIHSNIECGKAFNVKNKPLVTSIFHIVDSNEEWLSLAQKFYYKLVRERMRKSSIISDRVIAICKFAEQQVLELNPNAKVEVIYPGINIQTFKPMKVLGDDKIKLLFVGNLEKRHGFDLLPEIMKRLDDRFVLYYTSGLKHIMFSNARMIPTGHLSLDELVAVYNFCDILVYPVRLTGFGYCVAEAMSCGKPIISTNYSAIPELVEDGKGGFLCEKDNIYECASRIRQLGNDKDLRIEMGKYNREKVLEMFDINNMGRQYDDVYNRLS
jgi:glycosyltransferase involved in cell wall biosynthesis